MNELRVAMRNTPVPRLACVRVMLTIALASCGDVGPNTPSVANVNVTPGTLSLFIGQTGQFTATPRDEAGNALSGRAVSWTSLTPAVASVDGSGLVMALGAGTATVAATIENKSGTAAVTVSLVPVATVSVTPDHLDLRLGRTGQLTATPRDSAGNPLSGRAITWGSDTPGVATVDATGFVTTAGVGTATIRATSAGKSGTAVVTVSLVPVATVSVTPDHFDLRLGRTGQLTATPRDSAGNPLSGRAITWGSNAPGVATVDGAGLVTAAGVGIATITATSEGKSGTALVTVSLVPVATVSVTPDSLDLTVGQTRQLTATLRDSAGNVLSGRAVSWATLNPSIATVDGNGLVRALAAGRTIVAATSEGHSGMATVKVHETGLDFPGNIPVTTTMRFEFTTPFAAYPATYIWRAYPRQQVGYWTAFFHANNSSFFDNQLQYYGFHPYPDPPTDGTPKWEISVNQGVDYLGDTVVTRVMFDRWYLQVAVVYQDPTQPTVYRHTYYWDWPDTTHKLVFVGSGWSPAPNPAIMVGDNPWNPGEEVWNGVLRGFQFYDVALTPSQIALEIAAPGSVHKPWYLNLNPTPDDILDKSGFGHHPSWVGNLRPTLWTGTSP